LSSFAGLHDRSNPIALAFYRLASPTTRSAKAREKEMKATKYTWLVAAGVLIWGMVDRSSAPYSFGLGTACGAIFAPFLISEGT
jgi:hypothetical protein